MKRTGILVTVILLAVIFIGAGFAYNKLSESHTPEHVQEENQNETPLQEAPDFTVSDTSGKSVSLSDFKGKPVVVNFWATWCPPCKSELPYFESLYREFGDKVEFMMVNLTDGGRETVNTVNTFLEDTGYTFPVYYDTEYSGAMAYGTYSIPVTVFVDSDGNLIYGQVGAISETKLRAYVESLIQKKSLS